MVVGLIIKIFNPVGTDYSGRTPDLVKRMPIVKEKKKKSLIALKNHSNDIYKLLKHKKDEIPHIILIKHAYTDTKPNDDWLKEFYLQNIGVIYNNIILYHINKIKRKLHGHFSQC